MFDPNDQRLRHLVEQVHELGPAPLTHLLCELDRGGDLEPTLERYAALPSDLIRALGGSRYAAPLQVVVGARR